jgi:hypothetical protein
MPIFSITRREAMFDGTVNETISRRRNVSKPNFSTAPAPSVAKPRFQNAASRRQPISTQWSEVSLKAWHGQSNVPCKRHEAWNLDGPQPKAVLLEMSFDSIRQSVAFCPG